MGERQQEAWPLSCTNAVVNSSLENLIAKSDIWLTLGHFDRLFKEANLCICDAAVHSAILRPFNELSGADAPRFESCLTSGIVLPLNSRRNRFKNLSCHWQQALDGSYE